MVETLAFQLPSDARVCGLVTLGTCPPARRACTAWRGSARVNRTWVVEPAKLTLNARVLPHGVSYCGRVRLAFSRDAV